MFSSSIFPSRFGGARLFSSTSIASRQWKLIEIAAKQKKPSYEVGQQKPLYFPKEKPQYPTYKYGERLQFKQSNRGLYGGSFPQFGHSITEFKNHVKRKWSLNIKRKKFWSEGLNETIQIKVTTRVLRTIEKEGGIDNYLIKDKSARIKELGPAGWNLRYRILARKEVKKSQELLPKVTVDGKQLPVFHIDHNKNVQLLVGKRKLLGLLYPLVAKNTVKKIGMTEFMVAHRDLSFQEVVDQLHNLGFDFSGVSVPVHQTSSKEFETIESRSPDKEINA